MTEENILTVRERVLFLLRKQQRHECWRAIAELILLREQVVTNARTENSIAHFSLPSPCHANAKEDSDSQNQKKEFNMSGGKMDESLLRVIPDRLYTKCLKADFEQSGASLSDSGIWDRLFFSTPKDITVSEDEIVLEIDAAAFKVNSTISFVKDGCWKSDSPLYMAHIREYKKPSL